MDLPVTVFYEAYVNKVQVGGIFYTPEAADAYASGWAAGKLAQGVESCLIAVEECKVMRKRVVTRVDKCG